MSDEANAQKVLLAIFVLQQFPLDQNVLRQVMLDSGDADSFGSALVERGLIDQQQLQAIRQVVTEHLSRYGGDASAGLQAIHRSTIADDIVEAIVDTYVNTDPKAFDTAPLPNPSGNTNRPRPLSISDQSSDDFPEYETIAPDSSTASGDDGGGAVRRGRAPVRFLSRRLHAQGGLGEIYLADDLEINRQVALKEIKDGYRHNPVHRRMFVIEGAITGCLEHPGVVPVYGMGRYADGRPFYAMRFIHGESLAKAIREFHADRQLKADPQKWSLKLRQLLNRFVSACDTIHYAHSRGVLHRDIKPDNIMLGPYGETIVVDWGLATTFVSPGTTAEPSNDDSGLRISVPELDGPPENGRITGTVQYMPPEQALGRHDEMYEASDVFSLGATLYTLLVNQPMYSGTKMAEVLKLAQQRQAVPARQVNSRVPAALDAIVEKATARAPADRYQTARQLADDIEAFLADEPVSARPDPFADRVRRWLRHHRAWAMSALAAIFVAIVGLSAVAAVLSVKNAEVAAERDVAQQNLESARQAVRQSLVMVSEDPQLKEEGMLALRHRLLTAPEGYYQKFLTQSPDDPHLKAEQAEWLLLLSRASYDAKTRAEALQNVRRAEEIYQSLVAAVPTNDEYLNGLARAQNLLGVFLKDTGKMQEAHDQFTAAVGMAERHLAADAAASPITLVAALANLAETNIYFDDRVAATQLLRRAIELRDKGLANFPQDGPLMRTNPQEILIGVLYDNGKIAEALDMSESYIRELRSFEPAADEANEMRYTLARQIQLQAEVLNAKGLPHRAMTVYREANDVVQRLLAVSPGNTRYQSLASELNIRLLQPADVSVFLADMGQISKQHDESDARVTRAIERDPDVLQNHVDLCMIRLESAGLEFQVPNIAAAKTKIANAQQAIESAIARFGNHRTLSWLQSYLFAFQAQLRQQDGQHAEADRLLAHADEAFRAGKSQATTVPEEFRRVEIESVAMDLALMQEDADRAAVALQRMDDALAQVAEEYKNTPAYRRTVAQRYTLDARLLLLKGDSEAADHSLVEAIQVREKIVADFPDEPLYRTELFQAHTGAGTSIAQRELNRSAADSDSGIDMDRIQLVFGHLRAALEQIDNLDPQTLSVAFLESVVNVRQEITSGMFLQLIENDEIVHELRAAIRIYRGLLERTGHAKYIVGIATYELRLAQHLDNEESLTITNQAAASLGRYVAEFPDDESAREVLWNVHTIQGEYYWDQGRYEEARQSFEHAAEMNGVNDPTHARIRLANVHAIMGDYGTAIDLLRHTESIPEMTGVDWYNVGCGYALAVDAARADMRLTDGGRKELTETYALAAIRALYHAKDLGDFADVDDLEYLRDGDESLRSLRDRDDFREFVQEVQQSLDGGEQNSE